MGAHSHLDAFWLETYSEYFNGSGHDGLHSCITIYYNERGECLIKFQWYTRLFEQSFK